MDAVILGILVGLATGLVPGLHVNTLAALALASLDLTADIALALVAVGTVHTIVSILPATYLGLPGEDMAIATLPAHRLVAEGRGPMAVRTSVAASTWAMVCVVLALLPVKWLLAAPLHGAARLASVTPWILGGVLLLLLLQERRWVAVPVMLLAGGLGALAQNWPVTNPWQLPGSALLPLLTGLFAAPTLLSAGHHGLPPQRRAGSLPRMMRPIASGTAVAAFTSVLPGLTAAVATAMAGARDDDPRRVLATLSTVNTAHHGFALAMLWIVGTTRSGLADAVRPAFRVTPWNGAVPLDLHAVLRVAMLATLVGAVGTLLLEPWVRRAVGAMPGRALHRGALALLVGLVVLLTGFWGLALFVAATVVGHLPLHYRIRRVHLAACLILPLL